MLPPIGISFDIFISIFNIFSKFEIYYLILFFYMSKQSELGILGEALAAEYLLKKDYVILEKNYTWEKSEIDIITTKNNRIIFIEVKTRQSPYLSDPALMVPMKKWKQIMRAADVYMKEKEESWTAQFDIIHVVTNKDYTKIDHYDEAFTPGV